MAIEIFERYRTLFKNMDKPVRKNYCDAPGPGRRAGGHQSWRRYPILQRANICQFQQRMDDDYILPATVGLMVSVAKIFSFRNGNYSGVRSFGVQNF